MSVTTSRKRIIKQSKKDGKEGKLIRKNERKEERKRENARGK